MLTNLALALGIAAAIYLMISRSSGSLGVEDAKGLVQNGALLLDVRTPQEFAAGHIDGAVNIPVQELSGRMDELKDKERPIVVYCRSGARSGQAQSMLQGQGYEAVHNLGAMTRWK